MTPDTDPDIESAHAFDLERIAEADLASEEPPVDPYDSCPNNPFPADPELFTDQKSVRRLADSLGRIRAYFGIESEDAR